MTWPDAVELEATNPIIAPHANMRPRLQGLDRSMDRTNGLQCAATAARFCFVTWRECGDFVLSTPGNEQGSQPHPRHVIRSILLPSHRQRVPDFRVLGSQNPSRESA